MGWNVVVKVKLAAGYDTVVHPAVDLAGRPVSPEE